MVSAYGSCRYTADSDRLYRTLTWWPGLALGPMLEKVGAQPKIIQDAFLVSVCSKLKWISACPGSHGYADSSDQFAEFLTSFGNCLEFTSIMSANCTAPWVQRIVN